MSIITNVVLGPRLNHSGEPILSATNIAPLRGVESNVVETCSAVGSVKLGIHRDSATVWNGRQVDVLQYPFIRGLDKTARSGAVEQVLLGHVMHPADAGRCTVFVWGVKVGVDGAGDASVFLEATGMME